MSMLKGLFSDAEFTVAQGKRWLFIQSSGTAEEPSGVVYQSTDGTTHTKRYTWFDQDGNFRMKDDSEPTDEDADGSVLFGTSTAGANITLSNLGTVALTAILAPAATTTTDVGTSSKYFNDCYLGGKLYLSSTVTLDAGASARLDIVGDIIVGVDGTGNDLTLYADTAGDYVKWDPAGCTNVGTLTFTDDTQLVFGESSDFTIDWNQTSLVLDNKTANTGNMVIGSAVATNVEFHGTTDTSDAGWDSSADTFQICDDAVFNIGGSALETMDGFWFKFIAADSVMYVEARTENDTIEWGKASQMDWLIHGNTASTDITWDASANTWTYLDNAILAFGTGDDFTFAFDGTLLNIVHAVGTTGGITLTPLAATTVAALHIDGATNDWDGADNVGMLHISGDTALIHAGASLLNVTQATTAPITAAEGFLARFISTATARTNAYAVEIEVPVTQPALSVNSIVNITGVTTANAAVLQVTGNDATNDVNAVTINNEGSDYALLVTGDDVDSGCIKTVGLAAQTASQVLIDGTTGTGWDGADGVGMLQVSGDGAHIHANASLVNIIDGTGASIASGRGTSLRIVDTTTVGADSWVAYIATTANDGLLINTGHANGINLKLTGLQAQIAPMMLIDGSTGTGWDGADDVGMLELTSDSDHVHAGATMLRVENSAQSIAAAQGTLARFENTGTARADAVMVEIVAKDHDEYALNVGTGMVKITDWVTAGGYHHNVTDVTATDAGLQLTDKYGFYTFDETTGDNGDILLLPTAVAGMEMWLQNIDAAQAVEVTPFSGEQINALGADAAVDILAGELLHVICSVTGHWRANIYSADGTITKAT